MPFGGIVGEATIVGPGLDAWWPLLWMGQWIGVGKGVTTGLGDYRVGIA
jgi:CRISPR/Cas system endoribonuclease Cas6 (RAMP superfamily)